MQSTNSVGSLNREVRYGQLVSVGWVRNTLSVIKDMYKRICGEICYMRIVGQDGLLQPSVNTKLE